MTFQSNCSWNSAKPQIKAGFFLDAATKNSAKNCKSNCIVPLWSKLIICSSSYRELLLSISQIQTKWLDLWVITWDFFCKQEIYSILLLLTFPLVSISNNISFDVLRAMCWFTICCSPFFGYEKWMHNLSGAWMQNFLETKQWN